MCIGKDVTGIFQDKFELVYGLKEMIEDTVMTKFELIYGY
jgi:hypothetical protein